MISTPYSSGYVCFQNCDNWEDYTIKEKDTLYNISVKFGVPIRMLMSCNKNINPYNLQVGQVIKVPASKPEALGCISDSEERYTIELKDTLFSISEKVDTTVEELIKMNPGIDPYNLKPGMKICVPKKKVQETQPSNQLPPSAKPYSSNKPSISVQPARNNNPAHIQIQQETQMTEPKPAYQSMPDENLQNMPKSDNLKYNEHSNNAIYGWNNAQSLQNNPNIMENNSKLSMTTANNNYSNSDYENIAENRYTIQEGDSLESIIEKTNLTYASLVFANPGINFMELITGSEICIPLWDTFEGCNSGTFYIIKNGDSLSLISKKFNVNESALISANPFNKTSDFSTPGIRICIPE